MVPAVKTRCRDDVVQHAQVQSDVGVYETNPIEPDDTRDHEDVGGKAERAEQDRAAKIDDQRIHGMVSDTGQPVQMRGRMMHLVKRPKRRRVHQPVPPISDEVE